MENLKEKIALGLHSARVEDFLRVELKTMASIFSIYVVSNKESCRTPSPRDCIVTELWDTYLSRVSTDDEMSAKGLMDLIEIVPISSRESHDLLYKAINSFLQTHPEISQDEKAVVCKHLNCKKLSHEICIEAVQNELMPLRLIVQALFVQQLHTHQAFRECSDSFRYTNTNCGEFSGSLSSSICHNVKGLNLIESPYTDIGEGMSRPLSFLAENDVSKSEIESTSFRIQNLEQELMSLKKNLHLCNITTKTKTVSKISEPILYGRMSNRKRNPMGQVSACMGTVNFASHRKYANRLLKVFRRINLFGFGKSKRE